MLRHESSFVRSLLLHKVPKCPRHSYACAYTHFIRVKYNSGAIIRGWVNCLRYVMFYLVHFWVHFIALILALFKKTHHKNAHICIFNCFLAVYCIWMMINFRDSTVLNTCIKHWNNGGHNWRISIHSKSGLLSVWYADHLVFRNAQK